MSYCETLNWFKSSPASDLGEDTWHKDHKSLVHTRVRPADVKTSCASPDYLRLLHKPSGLFPDVSTESGERVGAPTPSEYGVASLQKFGDLLTELHLTTALKRRLSELEALYYEDEGKTLVTDSVEGLWTFVLNHPNCLKPLLTAEPDGRLIATWKQHKNLKLTVRFQSAELLQYVLTGPAQKGDIKTQCAEQSISQFALESQEICQAISS